MSFCFCPRVFDFSIKNMHNHHSGCHGDGEMFLYEWKGKAPYCVCIDLDFFSSRRMKRKQKVFVIVMVPDEGSEKIFSDISSSIII